MIGEILDGKYRIDNQLGAGGMGNVYLATHLGTTRVVAVKVIAPRWAAEPQFLARFQREAQACGRLRHPNIVNVTDFGIAKAPGGDTPYHRQTVTNLLQQGWKRLSPQTQASCFVGYPEFSSGGGILSYSPSRTSTISRCRSVPAICSPG